MLTAVLDSCSAANNAVVMPISSTYPPPELRMAVAPVVASDVPEMAQPDAIFTYRALSVLAKLMP